MSAQVVCPRCDFVVQPETGGSPPSHCPACGTRICCPRCGSSLQSHPGETIGFRCGHCNFDLVGLETLPMPPGKDIRPGSPLELPGFELRGELGRGGMGIVYRAYQHSLQRDVAIKVLPPALAANTELLTRFRNEAAVAARLTDAHVLPVFDIREVDGVPVIVMPVVEGCDLGRIIRDRQAVRKGQTPDQPHPWANLDDSSYLSKILPLLDHLVAAVSTLHGNGVLHRDIKPSNVLLDGKGNLWLSDFGLARLEEQGAVTQPGMVVGTISYSSPEQASGHTEIDFRADLFSLGATLYHALTLELPYGKGGIKAASPPPLAPSKRQTLLSPSIDRVLLRALAREPSDRQGSAADFQRDWENARQGLPSGFSSATLPQKRPPALRRPLVALGVAALALAGLVAFLLFPRSPTGPYRRVRLTTEPAGARVVLVHREADPARPLQREMPAAVTPLTVENFPAGDCLVIALLPDGRFQEVLRTVPEPGQKSPGLFPHQSWVERRDGSVELPLISIPPASVTEDMVPFKGNAHFLVGSRDLDLVPPHERLVSDFLLDSTEVTVGAYRKIMPLPDKLQARPVPDNHAVCWVTFDEATAYAEKVGKRLPSELELEFAATNGGKTRFPWGDDARLIQPWTFGPVRQPAHDRTRTVPPVYGLFSNVTEWTSSRYDYYPGTDPEVLKAFQSSSLAPTVFAGSRVVRGGPFAVTRGDPDPQAQDRDQEWDPRHREAISMDERYPGLGFRCARSARPPQFSAID
jgi:eukaryotic-like serine/threonine-protein kinase